MNLNSEKKKIPYIFYIIFGFYIFSIFNRDFYYKLDSEIRLVFTDLLLGFYISIVWFLHGFFGFYIFVYICCAVTSVTRAAERK